MTTNLHIRPRPHFSDGPMSKIIELNIKYSWFDDDVIVHIRFRYADSALYFYIYLAHVGSVDCGPRSTESVTNSLGDIVPNVMYVASSSCLNLI